jgi:hypothetical protein
MGSIRYRINKRKYVYFSHRLVQADCFKVSFHLLGKQPHTLYHWRVSEGNRLEALKCYVLFISNGTSYCRV